MARGETPWINEGPLRKRYRMEGDQLITELNQPDRDLIVDSIQTEKREAPVQRTMGGYKVASIPLVDLERVRKAYPAIFERGADQDLRARELVKFSSDPRFSEFVIKKS